MQAISLSWPVYLIPVLIPFLHGCWFLVCRHLTPVASLGTLWEYRLQQISSFRFALTEEIGEEEIERCGAGTML